MSISSEISRISTNINNALNTIANMGGEIMIGAKSDNLADLIATIPTYYDGIRLYTPASGTRVYTITVPNGGSDTVTFTFTVDSSGNTTIE